MILPPATALIRLEPPDEALLAAVLGPPRTVVLVAVVTLLAAGAFGLVADDGFVWAQATRLGIIALLRHQSKVMAWIGLGLGAVATIVSIVVAVGLGAAIDSVQQDDPAVTATSEPAPVRTSPTPSSAMRRTERHSARALPPGKSQRAVP